MQLPSSAWAVPTGGLPPAASRGFTQGVREPPHDRPIGCGPLRRASGHRYWPPVAVRGVRNRAPKSCAAHLDAKRMWTPAECWAVKRPPNSRLDRRALTCCCHAAAC
eukprot:1978509-Prymnesium_polylepis.1